MFSSNYILNKNLHNVIFKKLNLNINKIRNYNTNLKINSNLNSNYFIKNPLNISTLNERINEKIFSSKNAISEETVIKALYGCSLILKKSNCNNKQSSPTQKLLNIKPIGSASKLALKIIESDKTPLNNNILKNYFLSEFPPSTSDCIKALEAFYKKINKFKNNNEINYIKADIAMIPFRRALINEEIEDAFTIIDLTSANENYLKYNKKQLNKIILKILTGWGTLIGSVSILLNLGYLGINHQNISTLLWMTSAYIVTSTMMIGITLTSRTTDKGGRVRWRQGVFYNHWIIHRQELLMITKLIEAEELIPENQGDISPNTRLQLKKRLMILDTSPDEVMLKEYWIRNGEGFQWVEPDQDPADLQIRERNKYRQTKSLPRDVNNFSNDVIKNLQPVYNYSPQIPSGEK